MTSSDGTRSSICYLSVHATEMLALDGWPIWFLAGISTRSKQLPLYSNIQVDENLTNLDLEKKQEALSLIQRNRCCLDGPDQLFRISIADH